MSIEEIRQEAKEIRIALTDAGYHPVSYARLAVDKLENELINSRAKVFYLIRYGLHYDMGFIPIIASNEAEIIEVVKNDDTVMSGNGIVDVMVDFENLEINYTYEDFTGEMENGKLHFDKVTLY